MSQPPSAKAKMHRKPERKVTSQGTNDRSPVPGLLVTEYQRSDERHEGSPSVSKTGAETQSKVTTACSLPHPTEIDSFGANKGAFVTFNRKMDSQKPSSVEPADEGSSSTTDASLLRRDHRLHILSVAAAQSQNELLTATRSKRDRSAVLGEAIIRTKQDANNNKKTKKKNRSSEYSSLRPSREGNTANKASLHPSQTNGTKKRASKDVKKHVEAVIRRRNQEQYTTSSPSPSPSPSSIVVGEDAVPAFKPPPPTPTPTAPQHSDPLTSADAISCSKGIALPGPKDVLFGRGKQHSKRLGNKRMQELVRAQRAAYEQSGRDDKTDIAWMIVKEIQEEGGRFLKFDKALEVWFEVEDGMARNKVSHAMRGHRAEQTSNHHNHSCETKCEQQIGASTAQPLAVLATDSTKVVELQHPLHQVTTTVANASYDSVVSTMFANGRQVPSEMPLGESCVSYFPRSAGVLSLPPVASDLQRPRVDWRTMLMLRVLENEEQGAWRDPARLFR